MLLSHPRIGCLTLHLRTDTRDHHAGLRDLNPLDPLTQLDALINAASGSCPVSRLTRKSQIF
jgi:organic hydroperoxide reductase OsmC/OhrA